MKVAIFDTEHFEVTFAVIRFFDNGRNDITIYIYENSFVQLEYLLKADVHKYTWVIKKEAGSKPASKVWNFINQNLFGNGR